MNKNISFGIEFLANEHPVKLAELIKFSEDNGLEYAWITDHYNNRDAYALLAYIASKTNKIKLGPGVTNPYTRIPEQIASAIETINEISNGRAVLGIGAGDKVTFDKIGIKWKKPISKMQNAIETIRKSAKDIPIYIGAQGPKMLKLAGELGDGALVNASHPLDFKVAIELLKEGGAKNKSNFDVGAYTSFSIAENSGDAIRAAKPVVAFIVAGSPNAVFEKHDIALEEVNAVRSGFKKKFQTAIDAVTPKMIESFSISGTPKECIQRIEELIEVGVTQIIPGSPLGPDKVKAIKLIGSEII